MKKLICIILCLFQIGLILTSCGEIAENDRGLLDEYDSDLAGIYSDIAEALLNSGVAPNIDEIINSIQDGVKIEDGTVGITVTDWLCDLPGPSDIINDFPDIPDLIDDFMFNGELKQYDSNIVSSEQAGNIIYSFVRYPGLDDGGLLVSVDLDDPEELNVICNDPDCDHMGRYCYAWVSDRFFSSQYKSYIIADGYDYDDRTILYIFTKDSFYKDGMEIEPITPMHYKIYRYDPIENTKDIVSNIGSFNIDKCFSYGDYLFFSEYNNIYSCNKTDGNVYSIYDAELLNAYNGKIYYKYDDKLYNADPDLTNCNKVYIPSTGYIGEQRPFYYYKNTIISFVENYINEKYDGGNIGALSKIITKDLYTTPLILDNIVFASPYMKISGNRLYYVGMKLDKNTVNVDGKDETEYTITNKGIIHVIDLDYNQYLQIDRIDTGTENSVQLVECSGDCVIYKTVEQGAENYYLTILGGETYDLGASCDVSAIINK